MARWTTTGTLEQPSRAISITVADTHFTDSRGHWHLAVWLAKALLLAIVAFGMRSYRAFVQFKRRHPHADIAVKAVEVAEYVWIDRELPWLTSGNVSQRRK